MIIMPNVTITFYHTCDCYHDTDKYITDVQNNIIMNDDSKANLNI